MHGYVQNWAVPVPGTYPVRVRSGTLGYASGTYPFVPKTKKKLINWVRLGSGLGTARVRRLLQNATNPDPSSNQIKRREKVKLDEEESRSKHRRWRAERAAVEKAGIGGEKGGRRRI